MKSKAVSRKEFLKLLSESKSPKRRKLLADWASKRDIEAVSEIALNTLKGNIKLAPSHFKKLKRKQKALRCLASKKLGIQKKKQILKQHGGFLPALVPIAMGVAAEIIPSVLKEVF